jgi:hypothetical protein
MKELLILLGRYPWDDNRRRSLQELAGNVTDWPLLTGLINAHGIIALAYYNLRSSGLEGIVPESSLAFLEQGYRQNVVRNLWLKEKWKELDSILSAAGIRHVLLKGMALEHTLYGAQGLRQMSDIDILIGPGESLKAWELLQTKGYEMKPLKSPLFNKLLFSMGKHLPALFREDCSIEIHERLFESDQKNPDPFSGLRRIDIDGRPALLLNEKTHLEYLAEHFRHHAASGECPVRSYADLINLDPDQKILFPDDYVLKPFRGDDPFFRRKSFRAIIRALPPSLRPRFIAGDIFPSVKWMKERYRTGDARIFLKYPRRLGKLLWLLGNN